MDKDKKPKEFSKKIFGIIITLFTIVMLYSMALMWRTGDTSPLMYLIPSVSTLATTSVGFYYWKAKMENVIKLTNSSEQLQEELENLKSQLTADVVMEENFNEGGF